MAEMKKKGRCWKGYKPKPGAKPYSKGSCIPEGANPVEDAEAADFGGKPLVKNPLRPKGDNLVRMKKRGKVKEGCGKLDDEPSGKREGGFPSEKEILSANDKERAKKKGKLKEIKATPTPAARKKNPNARANDPANRAAAIQGRLSARVQSREDYPEGSPLRSGGSSKQDKNRASKLSKISGIEENDARAAYKKDDSDARAHDTFDNAEPFERRPYSHNSASTSDMHSFARDQGDSSRQPKKVKGSKESERSQNNRRKYLKSMLRRKRSNG